MAIEYDEKGKFYTNVVTKLPVAAAIQTTTHLIRGFLHIRQGERLKNELEADEFFLAVTDAAIQDDEGNVIFNVPFMAVQRTQIVWIFPVEGEPREDAG